MTTGSCVRSRMTGVGTCGCELEAWEARSESQQTVGRIFLSSSQVQLLQFLCDSGWMKPTYIKENKLFCSVHNMSVQLFQNYT